MKVEIVTFPETKVAVVEHLGPPETEHQSIMKLVSWRKENNYPPSPKHRNYGIHYNDVRKDAPEKYRVDIGISVEDEILPNQYDVINKMIPECRCAKARHLGSRDNVKAAGYLYDVWLPTSGEQYSGAPIIFHYVNIGPQVSEEDMITDVYLPLK